MYEIVVNVEIIYISNNQAHKFRYKLNCFSKRVRNDVNEIENPIQNINVCFLV